MAKLVHRTSGDVSSAFDLWRISAVLSCVNSPIVSQLLGKPIQEGFSEVDFINAIHGATHDDPDRLRKGLGVLKKSHLKRVYAAVTGEGDGVGADDASKEGSSETAHLEVGGGPESSDKALDDDDDESHTPSGNGE